MGATLNVYCDESCHLERDRQKVMVLGAVWCPLDATHEIATRLREIKALHGFPRDFEMKWTKMSPAKHRFYLEVLDYFFDDDDLHFRALVVPDKTQLQHSLFHQTHDDWYYKMYFDMLKVILSPDARYRIYLDIKDTKSSSKVAMLHKVLCNNMYDFSRKIIERVQTVRSNEVEILQLADLLIGAIAYVNRCYTTSSAKVEFVKRMQRRSRYSLRGTTLLRENKVNIFIWHSAEQQG